MSDCKPATLEHVIREPGVCLIYTELLYAIMTHILWQLVYTKTIFMKEICPGLRKPVRQEKKIN